jgi:sec-independent protein translocase protein TatB
MLSLSPAKLLVVLVIALIVLGPEKLPQMAKSLGSLWADVRRWRSRVESEVRGSFPDLPPTHEVVQAVRSPLSFLDRLADAHEGSTNGEGSANGDGAPGVASPSGTDPPAAIAQGAGETSASPPPAQRPKSTPGWQFDDPSMN